MYFEVETLEADISDNKVTEVNYCKLVALFELMYALLRVFEMSQLCINLPWYLTTNTILNNCCTIITLRQEDKLRL